MRDELLFKKTVTEYALDRLILKSGVVVTAFSGGADSSALLRLMDEYCKSIGVAHASAHVNHMIRGEEADRDENFCREVCESLGIPLYVLRVDVPAIAEKSGKGLEECAREVRYDFFANVSEKLTGSKTGAVIATAHNADDNLETVIFNMLRGCGSRGMCGIPPIRDGRYIRPLIYAGGEEIRAWCDANGVSYVIDRTNSSTDYTRNRIRHCIVPEMRKISSNPAAAVSRMTSLIRQDEDFLDSTARSYIRDDNTVERKILTELHPALSSRVLRILYKNISGKHDIEETHIRAALELSATDTRQASLSMPHGFRFKLGAQYASFVGAEEKTAPPEYNGETVFEYPNDGEKFENEMFLVTFSPNEHNSHTININDAENIYKLSTRRTLCFDKIVGNIRIRYRTAGDSYRFGNMTRKVKKLFGDRKISESERRLTPIFEDDLGIVWIPGFPPRDGVCTPENNGSQILINVFRKIT